MLTEATGGGGRRGRVVADLLLVLLAGLFVLSGLIALEQPSRQVYPPPASSERVRSYVIGAGALATGIGLVAFVVLRGGRVGWRSLRRLAGALSAGAVLPVLVATLNAALFGATAAVCAGLAIAVGLVAVGAHLLRRADGGRRQGDPVSMSHSPRLLSLIS